MILFKTKKKLVFMIYFVFLFFSLLSSLKAKQTEQSADVQYENIVNSIKDNPRQAIKDLKKLVDKNNSAAIEYPLRTLCFPRKPASPHR